MTARAPGAARLLARTGATAPAASALIVLLVAVLAFLSVFAPAAVEKARTDTVRAALDAGDPVTRDPSGTIPGLPAVPAEGDPWVPTVRQAAAGLYAAGAELSPVMTPPKLVSVLAPTPLVPERAAPKNQAAITVTPLLDGLVEYTSGTAPDATADGALQVAVSEATATSLDWPVGETRAGGYTGDLPVQVVLTGIFRARDADDPDWAHLPRALRPSFLISGSGERIELPMVFVAADAVRGLTRYTDVAATTLWFGFRPTAVDASSSAGVAAAVRRLSSTPVALDVSTASFFNAGVELRTTAPRLLDEGSLRGDAMTAVLAVVAIGPLVTAFVVAGLAGRVLAERRSPYLRLMRARGASAAATSGFLALNGLALGAAGAVAGIGAALAVVAGSGLPVVGAGLAVAVLFVLVPAAVVPVATAMRLAAVGRADLGAPEPTRARTRLLVEGAVVLATAAVVLLLLTRTHAAADVDPLLVAMPVLLAGTASVLAIRLLPVLLERAEGRGRRSAGLVPLLGPARARRDSAIRAAAVLCVVIGLAIAVFAVSFAATISNGITVVANTVTGGDVRVTGVYFTSEGLAAVAKVPGVDVSAGLRDSATVPVTGAGASARPTVYSVDSAALAKVQRDLGPSRLRLDGLQADSEATPVLVSQSLADELGSSGLASGGRKLHVTAVVPDQNPFGTATRWMVLDASRSGDLMRASTGAEGVFARVAPGADPHRVAAQIAAVGGAGAIAVVAQDVVARNAADPALAAVRSASLAAVAVVAVLLAVGVAMTLVLGGAARRRAFAVIRALGNPRRDEVALVAWEVTPALLLAVPFGAAAGAALSFLVLRALDLRPFVGGIAQPTLQFGGWWQAAVVAGCVVIAGAAVLVAARVATRAEAAEAVRGSERA